MALGSLPTRDEESLGPAVENRRTPRPGELSADHVEAIKDVLIDVATDIGIDASPAEGSIKARLAALEDVEPGAGDGDVTGPASSEADEIATYASGTGKELQSSGIKIIDNGGSPMLLPTADGGALDIRSGSSPVSGDGGALAVWSGSSDTGTAGAAMLAGGQGRVAGGAVVVQGGYGLDGGAEVSGGSGGNATVDAGPAGADGGDGTGLAGTVEIGTSHAREVTIARTGVITYVGGDLHVEGNLTVDGTSPGGGGSLPDPSGETDGDVLTVAGGTAVWITPEAAPTLDSLLTAAGYEIQPVDQSDLAVEGGDRSATGNGGTLTLKGGAALTSGLGGDVVIDGGAGTSDAGRIDIGLGTTRQIRMGGEGAPVNVLGTLTVTGAISGPGALPAIGATPEGWLLSIKADSEAEWHPPFSVVTSDDSGAVALANPTHVGRVMLLGHATANVATAGVFIPGASFELVQSAAGPVTVVGDGVTVRVPAGFVAETRGQWSTLVVTYIATDEAIVRGDLADA